MTDNDDDRDRMYPSLLHSPWFWWSAALCGLAWLGLVAWVVRT